MYCGVDDIVDDTRGIYYQREETHLWGGEGGFERGGGGLREQLGLTLRR